MSSEYPVKVTTFQSSDLTWKAFLQVWSKRVVPFRFHLFQRDHPLIAHVITVLLCDGPLSPVLSSLLTRLYRIQHVATVGIIPQVRSALSRMFHHRRRASLIPYAGFFNIAANIWWMTCFWWQLAHNITIHITILSLNKGCFEINVEKIPTAAGCHMATHPKSRSTRSRRIDLQVILLLSWNPLNTHLDFALRKLPCLWVSVVSTHRPVTQFFGLNFLQSTRSKKPHCHSRISNRGVSL